MVGIVQLKNCRICSGYTIGYMKIWNLSTGVCDMTLRGHTRYITAIVVIDEMRICSCSDDKSIKIWNLETGVCDITVQVTSHELTGSTFARWSTSSF